jgi:hypothetical protein
MGWTARPFLTRKEGRMTAHEKDKDTTQTQKKDAVPQAGEKAEDELADAALEKVSGGYGGGAQAP